jgi:hypothetical protein
VEFRRAEVHNLHGTRQSLPVKLPVAAIGPRKLHFVDVSGP